MVVCRNVMYWERYYKARDGEADKELDWHHTTRFKRSWHVLGWSTTLPERFADKDDWRWCVVQCVFNTGWTKDQGLSLNGSPYDDGLWRAHTERE